MFHFLTALAHAIVTDLHDPWSLVFYGPAFVALCLLLALPFVAYGDWKHNRALRATHVTREPSQPRLVTRTYRATEAQLPGMRRRLHQHGGRLVRSAPSRRGYVVTVALPEDVLARMEHNHAPDAEDARMGFVVFPRIACPACVAAHTDA